MTLRVQSRLWERRFCPSIYILKIGLVDDSCSDAAAATAARMDLGRSAALAMVIGSAAAEAAASRSRSCRLRLSEAVFKLKPHIARCWLVILRELQRCYANYTMASSHQWTASM